MEPEWWGTKVRHQPVRYEPGAPPLPHQSAGALPVKEASFYLFYLSVCLSVFVLSYVTQELLMQAGLKLILPYL